MRSIRQWNRSGILALLAFALFEINATPASASTIVYDFTGTLVLGGGTVTGDFTWNTTSQTISTFSFSLPNTIQPVTPPSNYTLNNSDGTYTYDSVVGFSFYTPSFSIPYFTSLDLDMTILSNGLLQLGSGGGLMQFPNVDGEDANFDAFFTSDNLTATPLPPALPLFATGFGSLGLLGWRRKRKGLGRGLINAQPQPD
jgi:hypothetical protein